MPNFAGNQPKSEVGTDFRNPPPEFTRTLQDLVVRFRHEHLTNEQGAIEQ